MPFRQKYDDDFKDAAVRTVLESGLPIVQVAEDLGLNEGTLGNWVRQARSADDVRPLCESEREELKRLRKDNRVLRMERDVLKRSTALWVDEAMNRNK